MTYIVTIKTGLLRRSYEHVEGIPALSRRLAKYKASNVKVTAVDSFR